MYCIEVIRAINENPVRLGFRPSSVLSRDCSHCTSKQGTVIHSARARDTVFIGSDNRNHSRYISKLKSLSGSAYNRYCERLYARYCA